jgi:hypothetical protein
MKLTNKLAISCPEERAWTEVNVEDSNNGKTFLNKETAFHATEKIKMSKFSSNTWLGDTGASANYVNNDTGMSP